MKAVIVFFLTFTSIFMMNANDKISLTVNGRTLIISLADTEAARKLKTLIDTSSLTIRLNDYGGFEKVGELPWSLPTSNRQISTVPGDVMLYQGNNIVIFYGTNSWSYTPLGKIEGVSAEELRNFLAGSRIDATLSADPQSGISDVKTDRSEELTVYTLQGVKIDMRGRTLAELPSGLYIVNGKKHLIK
ncbi:MAG: hypothetical protein K2H15_00290 [Muribaculaceae bacterium]|nr:hypothetical protein [Muribaculaceae bacterium]